MSHARRINDYLTSIWPGDLQRLAKHWDELRDRFRAAVAEAARQGWVFHILTDREIRTSYLKNIAFLQCAKGVDVDEMCRSRIASLLTAKPLTLDLILDSLTASNTSRPTGLAQIWKMALRGELVTDLALPLSMTSEFSLPKPEVGNDLKESRRNPRVERQKDAHSPDFYLQYTFEFYQNFGADFVRIWTLCSGTARKLVLRLHNTEASFLGIGNPDRANTS